MASWRRISTEARREGRGPSRAHSAALARRLLGAGAAVLTALIAAGCGINAGASNSAGGDPGTPLLSRADATSLVKQWVVADAAPFNHDDASSLLGLEEGSALVADQGTIAGAKAAGKTNPSPPVPDLQVNVITLPGRSYPASFLVEASGTPKGQAHFMWVSIFTKDSAGSPWRQAFYTYLAAGQAWPSVATGATGIAEPVDPKMQSGMLTDPYTVGTQYIEYYQWSAGLGPFPSLRFAPGPLTTTALTAPQPTSAQVNQSGHIDAMWAFKTSSGGALVLWAWTQKFGASLPSGQCFSQATDRTPWGPFIAPGSYSRASNSFEQLDAAVIPPRSAGAAVAVIAQGGSFTSGAGVSGLGC